MNSDSIYPDFLSAGVEKLQKEGRDGNLMGLFSALEHFRRDLIGCQEPGSVMKIAEPYIKGLDLFSAVGFYLVEPVAFDFELAHCSPGFAEELEVVVRQAIREGRFAWALRQSAPTIVTHDDASGPRWFVFHTLAVATRRLGMFCGLLNHEHVASQEPTFRLLSMLLGMSADALAGLRTTAELQSQLLAANTALERTLEENEVLARLPGESPNPVFRVTNSGVVLYANSVGLALLRLLGWNVGDVISGEMVVRLGAALKGGTREQFEMELDQHVYSFLVVPVQKQGYANFYGTDITARKVAEREREKLIDELQEALAKVKTLSGLVPICSWCKKIRDDQGFWNEVEVFVQSHSDAVFSHGVCPTCQKRWLKGAVKS